MNPAAAPCPENAGISAYIEALKASTGLGPQITNHTILPDTVPHYAAVTRPWPGAMLRLLEGMGIGSLYSHQALGLDALRAGGHVIAATPTASGKSLLYTLPMLERCLHDPEAKAIFLFPLKALAQDQLAAFNAMTGIWPEGSRPEAAVYDGDTSPQMRRKIREQPPQVLLTNPEMLHLSLLPHHQTWSTLFAGLSLVAVDEAHTYRGLLGSHMAQVFRRLLRIAGLYGASPSFVFCSATVGNPEELARLLTGARALPLLESGAPKGKRHYIFMNPLESPAGVAVKLLKAALARGLRSIVYCRSRRMTELMSLWVAEQSGPYIGKISAYRAGFLPEERREIEARMASGDLLAVISTSALELGIDIGGLDLCILVGYPGTVMSTLQRGGRVGRGGRESAVILLAGEDALDQYIVRHAEDFFARPPEKAVLNPENPVILERHLECAAAELPLRADHPADAAWFSPASLRCMEKLEKEGLLLRSANGRELLAARKRPQRLVSLRGSGLNVSIETGAGERIGSVDAMRARHEVHPGAVYIHLGRHFEITELNLTAGLALARPFRPSWYTRTRGHKETQILSLEGPTAWGGLAVQRGRLRITETVSGYEKRSVRDGRLLGVNPLDLPPLVFETEGLWLLVTPEAQAELEAARFHFMGAIHAVEHATIGLLPLQVLADRNDFGGLSTPMHPQTGLATVFVYDGLPGGAGLSRAAFEQAALLFSRALQSMTGCPCETGCPACVHSPKCGSGNRPIDKEGAIRLLQILLRESPETARQAETALQTVSRRLEALLAAAAAHSAPGTALNGAVDAWGTHPDAPHRTMHTAVPIPSGTAPGGDKTTQMVRPTASETKPKDQQAADRVPPSFVVLDVETRFSAAEVGGWHRAGRMGVSLAVLYDSRTDAFSTYLQQDIPALARILAGAPLVVGFNLLRFDYAVLAPHAPDFDFRALPTLDMLLKVHEQLSYRLSLDNLARATLGGSKEADGLMALQWWKEGRMDEIERYCRQDVLLTRDLYLYGREQGYLLFTNKAGLPVRVRADW